MSLDFENDENINSLLFLMATLSPRVYNSLDKESYRETAESDQSENQYILEDSLQNLMLDLNDIGLTFSIDLSDLIEDRNKFSRFLQLSSYLLPNTLYEIIKYDSNMRHLIESINDGSLGYHESTIQIYLSELAGLNGTVPLRQNLVDFIDDIYPKVIQTEVFSDYLSNLINLHKEERPSFTSDDKRHQDYRDIIRKFIGCLSDAVNLFEGWNEYDEILRLQNFMIKDLIAPDNFINYSYIFLESTNTLPEELIDNYNRKWYHYKVSHPWCYEYYTIPSRHEQGFSFSAQIMAACVIYAFIATKEQSYVVYEKEIAEFRRAYRGDKVDETIKSLFKE